MPITGGEMPERMWYRVDLEIVQRLYSLHGSGAA